MRTNVIVTFAGCAKGCVERGRRLLPLLLLQVGVYNVARAMTLSS